jgi:hypothetical protein
MQIFTIGTLNHDDDDTMQMQINAKTKESNKYYEQFL